MSGKRIVFTGGTGKAGRHAVPHLLAKGYKILNVDLKPLDLPGVNTLIADRPHTQLSVLDVQLQAVTRQHASATRSALAGLGHEAIELFTGPAAVNLRACNAPGCVLYFVKSHPRREWCSEACGNRARAARHYQRVRSQKHTG